VETGRPSEGACSFVSWFDIKDAILGFVVLEQRYSTFSVRVPPHIISLQLCTPRVVGA
jgi:hypothetical protein